MQYLWRKKIDVIWRNWSKNMANMCCENIFRNCFTNVGFVAGFIYLKKNSKKNIFICFKKLLEKNMIGSPPYWRKIFLLKICLNRRSAGGILWFMLLCCFLVENVEMCDKSTYFVALLWNTLSMSVIDCNTLYILHVVWCWCVFNVNTCCTVLQCYECSRNRGKLSQSLNIFQTFSRIYVYKCFFCPRWFDVLICRFNFLWYFSVFQKHVFCVVSRMISAARRFFVLEIDNRRVYFSRKIVSRMFLCCKNAW